MQLSLNEAATMLGKTPRQVRYMIKQGKITAEKVEGRLKIESDSLPLTEGQRRAAAARADNVREAVESAIEPTNTAGEAAKAKRYTVRDLRAFKEGEPLYRELIGKCGIEDPAVSFLSRSLELLAQGCHAFHPTDKVAYYAESREAASAAVTHLLIDGDPGDESRRRLADRLEQKVLPAIGGLIRAAERSGRRRRYDLAMDNPGSPRRGRR